MSQNSTPEGTNPNNNVKTIYLIRHGQTDFNKKGIIQGAGVDSDLNETGRRQAQQFFQHYRHIPFQKIYTSTLKRTHQTVEPFKTLSLPQQIIPELDEINWGKMEGALPTKENSAEFIDMIKIWRTGELDRAVAGGETPNQLYNRQRVGLQKILSQNEDPILICMHGRAMRSFISLLTGYALNLMDDFEHGNVCLYVLEKHPEQENFNILVRNSRIHLHEEI